MCCTHLLHVDILNRAVGFLRCVVQRERRVSHTSSHVIITTSILFPACQPPSGSEGSCISHVREWNGKSTVCVCVCVCVLLFPGRLLMAEQSSLTHWFLSSWQALLTPRSSCIPRPLLLTSPSLPLSLSLSLSPFLAELKSWIVGQQIFAQSEPD